MLFTKKNIDKE